MDDKVKASSDLEQNAAGSNKTETDEKIDFKAFFKQCTSDVHRIMDQGIENISRTLTTICDSSSERDSEKRNLEAKPEVSTEITEIIHQETEETNAFPKPRVSGFQEVVNQEYGGITESSKDFFKPSIVELSKVVDLLSELVNEITDQTTESTNITHESEGVLGSNSVGISEVADLKKVPKQYTTEVHEEMREAVEIINVTENSASTFDSNSKEDREKRDLEATSAPSKEDGELMEQTKESVNMPGTSKDITVLNTEKLDETPVPNENTAISAMESSENLEFLNAEKKFISGPKRKNRKRKAPPISEMLITSIKKTKRSNGVAFDDIKRYMEENYPVKVKALVKHHVSNYLDKFVDKGFLEKIDGADTERFIIKKSEFTET